MSEYQITKLADSVVQKAVSGDISEIMPMLSNENISDLISGMVTVLCAITDIPVKLASEAYSAVSEIFKQAIMSKERLEMETLRIKSDIMRMFNDHVAKAMDQLDLTNPITSETFDKTIKTLRELLESECKMIDPSPLQRIKNAISKK